MSTGQPVFVRRSGYAGAFGWITAPVSSPSKLCTYVCATTDAGNPSSPAFTEPIAALPGAGCCARIPLVSVIDPRSATCSSP